MKRIRFIGYRAINCILILTLFLMVVSCNRDDPDSVVGNPELDLENKGIELETTPYSDIELPEISTDGNPINAEYDPRGKVFFDDFDKKEKYYPNEKLVSFSGNYELSSGKYKMRVSEALICPADDKYIYFHFRIRNEFWLDTDPLLENEDHPAPYTRFEDGPYYEHLPIIPDIDYTPHSKVRIYLDPLIDSNVVKQTTFGTLLTDYNFRVIMEIIEEGELHNSCATIDSSRDRSDTIVGTYIGRLISVFEK